jgi:hypothetical protein
MGSPTYIFATASITFEVFSAQNPFSPLKWGAIEEEGFINFYLKFQALE